jgi:protein involved in polysaccharide export with SLBB domain
MNSLSFVGVTARRSALSTTVGSWALLVFCCVSMVGQGKQQTPVSSSELARQNMAHVAASTAQLAMILHRDPGLMVEVKRWIAKDATEHGQIIAEADLAEESIFDRLEIDVTFRSVVTALVQKYGYLLPTVNPDSPLAKQQDLVMQERAKWITEEEEADRQKLRQEQERALQQTQGCDPRNANCAAQNATTPYIQQLPQQQPGIDQYPSQQVPGMETPMTVPPTAPYNTPYNAPQQRPAPGNDVTDLLRTSGSDSLYAQQSQGGSAAGTGSPYGQDSEEGQGGYGPRRGSSGGMEMQDQGMGGDEFADLSLSSDFAGEAFSQMYANTYPSSGSYGSRSSSDGSYGNGPYGNAGYGNGPYNSGSYGVGAGASSYDLRNNNAIVRENMRRAREATTPNQRLVRRPNPYEQIPSLYDMYLQASARPPAVERFGMQVFENGTRDLQNLPMDLPVGPDYVLGPGDTVSVNLWGGVARRFPGVVDREGRLSLPEVGPVPVAGKSLAEVQELVQKTLRTQFKDVSADVSLSRLRTIRVYVVGDVLKPGAYDVGSLSTPLNALFAAGGPTGRGSLRILKQYRGNQLVQDVDVYDLLLHGVKGNIQRLENGDTVIAPPLGPEITIEGMVRRPAIYELKDEKSLADAFALAGGLLPTATLGHVEVQRVVAHQKQTMLSLDIPQDDSADQVAKQLESFKIQDGDKVRIFPIAPFNQDAVYLEGHVIRPGKYSFHDGMRVTDLIGSYKDILPEPALQYGEIIRLRLPDYRPTVQSFSLAEALADPKNSPLLDPLDTVQIFGRYDFESRPNVSVLGDVRSPGTYRTSGDIHLSDAIHLAGGLLPDAQTTDAQVFRYMPDSTVKILNVKLSSALEGNPADNIMLSSRDRVLIHKNAAAADLAAVTIKGEVVRPGRYPLTTDMRVSDLIRAAGGLKQSADRKTADLTHFVWKEEKQVTGEQERISLASALAAEDSATNGLLNNAAMTTAPSKGASSSDPTLNNGDVLTIRQVANWQDLGASMTVRGEVVHPGSYGIRPGERLSSVLTRAGGFGPAAYPYGALLMRPEVERLEERSYSELIQRVRDQQATLKLTETSTTDPDQKLSAESALTQWQTTIDNLISAPPTGRVTIQVSSNIHSWANTSRDITVRAGDVLIVPKRPSYVLVQGQVYGPTAVAYRPGKSAKWYITQAGGTTNMAYRKGIFVVRADGTVIGSHSSLWLTGDALGVALQPGDMVVAPEKALGGPPIWKTLLQNATVLSSLATSAILIATYY